MSFKSYFKNLAAAVIGQVTVEPDHELHDKILRQSEIIRRQVERKMDAWGYESARPNERD